MVTIADKTFRTAEDTSPLDAYEEVAFRSWAEANEYSAKGRDSKGLVLRRSIFPHSPGYDGMLARAGFVALALFAPTV